MSGISAYESVKNLYRELLRKGYKLHEIDEMDIHFWFELNEKEEIEEVTADDLSWL